MTITDRTAEQNPQPLDGGAEELDPARLSGHYDWVRSVARNLVRDPWSAEDVTQETLMAALAAPPRDVPDEQRMRAWLGRVAFNLSRLKARQGARQRAREVRVAREESLPSVSDELEAAGTLEALAKAIAELSAPYREVVEMRYFGEFSTAEIAKRTGTSELAVRKRLWRARNKLRDSLDHDPKTGRLLAAVLPWAFGEKGLRLQGLAGLAAGLALCAGAVWWMAEGTVDPGRQALRVAAAESGTDWRSVDPTKPALLQEDGLVPPTERRRRPSEPTRPETRLSPPETENVLQPADAPFLGLVIDLDGRARGGLELVDSGAPSTILAMSDERGEFRLPGQASELRVEARGEGWTTLVEARFEDRVQGSMQPVVVAPAADLFARVQDENGAALPGVRFELRCEERTWSRLGWPVRLDSAVLGEFASGADGRCLLADLPRDSGLVLAALAPGYEPLEIETSWLGDEETFVLRGTGLPRVLAGLVRHRDGRPAGGALVSLGLGSATADSDGRFMLPLLGVQPDSCLVATDPRNSAAAAMLLGFGELLRGGEMGEVVLELGEEHDPVEGRLSGPSAGGWLVAVFPAGGGALDEDGFEAPLAFTSSDEQGGFEFFLPRGAYDLYALDPSAPRDVVREGLYSGRSAWVVDLPSPAETMSFSATLRSEGLPLGEAQISVAMRLDGPQGKRRIGWKHLTGDAQGMFAFQGGLAAELEVRVTHPFLGTQPRAIELEGLDPGAVLDLSPPSFLAVSGAREEAASGAVLDAEGRSLRLQGPLRAIRRFDLHAGRSPVFEVPAEARWLQLDSPGGESRRFPIEPRSGAVLRVQP